jgi:hypothetical protein
MRCLAERLVFLKGRITRHWLQKQKALSSKAEKSLSELGYRASLVRAARKQRNQHHQVRWRKQPLVRLQSGSLRSARYETQMAALRKIPQMLQANTRERGNFSVGEYFLTGLYGNHGRVSQFPHRWGLHTSFDAVCSLGDAKI